MTAGTTLAEAYVRLRIDQDAAKKDLTSGLGKAGEDAGKKAGDGFSKTFKTAAATIGGAFAAVGIVSFLKDSVQGLADHNKVLRQTAAVIKSTGGVAGVTTQSLGDMSDQLEAMSGVDGDLILNGENVLATFTNIRNGVGKNNDVFNQATKAALDVSVALGQDMKSSAIQLGKALNDPVKGVSALTKVGVTFTDQQKKTIASLVKQGDVMGAQKVILAELNKEFGGSAKAAADPAARAEVAWHSLQDTIGGLLLPTVAKLETVFAGALGKVSGVLSSPSITKFGATISKGFGAAVKAGVNFVRGINWQPLIAVIMAVYTVIAKDLVPSFVALARTYGPQIASAIKSVWSAAGVLAPVLTTIGNVLHAIFGFIAGNKATVEAFVAILVAWKVAVLAQIAVTKLITVAQLAWDAAMDANPIGLIVLAIAALVAAIVYLATKTQFFQTIWKGVWGFLKAVGAWFAGPFVDFFKAVGKAIADWATGVWHWITDKWDRIIAAIKAVPGRIKAIASTMWDSIKNAFLTVVIWIGKKELDLIKLFASLPGKIGHALGSLVSILTAPFRAAFNRIVDLWNGTVGKLSFHVPSWVPGIGGKGFDVPSLPHLASGGDITRTGFATVGENGPETVLLPAGARVLPNGAAAAGAMPVINNHFYVDGQEFRGMIRQEIVEIDREDRRLTTSGAGARSSSTRRIR